MNGAVIVVITFLSVVIGLALGHGIWALMLSLHRHGKATRDAVIERARCVSVDVDELIRRPT